MAKGLIADPRTLIGWRWAVARETFVLVYNFVRVYTVF